ncbi:Uncharacterised protein g2024 [Pycnogonum litorale]
MLGIDDPYIMPRAMFQEILDAKTLPELEFPDIFNYFVNKSSVYTFKQLKAYKSLEGYKYFVSGWIKEILIRRIPANNVYVVIAKVSHSQRLSDKPLRPWVCDTGYICDAGEVWFAHCTCMAGLDEVCSHVAATCFGVETAVKSLTSTACTSKPCAWLQPNSVGVEYAEARKIDFTSVPKKRKIWRTVKQR